MPLAYVNGTKLHYEDAGPARREDTGPAHRDVLLLLHAFPLHAGMWSRQLASLGGRFRVVAPDYRGLGGSGAPPEASTMELLAEDVRALLAQLRIERAVVAGLSMGGYVALALHRLAPALFRGLVLCDTKAAADGDEARANREAFARNALEQGLSWVADDLTPKLLRKAPDPAVVREVRELIGQGTPAGVAAAQRGMARRPDSTATLASVRAPVLVLFGAEDALMPATEGEQLAKAARDGRFVAIPSAGHLSNLENPAAFDAALADFVAAAPA
jgi:3-oxoadipate enol-lactonase